jgi:hypothetical protein
MNIAKLDKAEVLAALYNGSKQQGLGFLDERGSTKMAVEEAREELKRTTYFDYLHGRVMKIDLSKDELDTWLYNRDNGHDAAERIIKELIRKIKTRHITKLAKELELERELID